MGIFYHKDSTDYFVVVELGMSLHILLDLDMRPEKGSGTVRTQFDCYNDGYLLSYIAVDTI